MTSPNGAAPLGTTPTGTGDPGAPRPALPPGGRWWVQPTTVTVGAAAVLFGLYQLGVRSGARSWPVPLVALGLVALVLDAAVAIFGARRPLMSVDAGGDATVGVDGSLSITVRRPPGRRVLVRMSSFAPGRFEFDTPGLATVEVAPLARGVLRAVLVELAVDGPLGLARVTRTLAVDLDRPLLVGPAPVPVDGVVVPPVGRAGGGTARPHRSGELTRAVRDHRAGDPLRQVHWPATARHGRLMVRDLEQPAERSVQLVVDLGPLSGADAERAAGYAAQAAYGLLEAGVHVDLVTLEVAGPVAADVASRLEVGRRLAVAVPGPALVRPEHPVLVVDPGGCHVEPVTAAATAGVTTATAATTTVSPGSEG